MSVTPGEGRRSLGPPTEQTNEDHVPVGDTCREGNAVLMSEEDFRSWAETMHLLRSHENARRLLDSIAEAEPAEVQPRRPAPTPGVSEDRAH
ncbi:type II toxin-antitoxin system prevent-host-death family antitoxin [Streptomyces hebeiensis]|uniref:Antitoxin n=1 Tax=Streptomyces hebeiensis TaxID=229486 RepID=A0ABN1UVU8_9ACTN